MIRALLVDDEPPARNRMRQLLDAAGDVAIVGEAGSAIEARELIRATRPDLLFLDVEMPEVRGTALAAELPEPRPFIVFATAFERYALEAIAVDATDYLLKPVSRAKLAITLDRVRARLAKQRVEHDVAAASAVQAQMWPGALPAMPGFDCAAASLPARGVGGDFYDLFPLARPGHWALLLGDASGKGVAAGLVASAVQARVNAAARHAGLEPAPLMAAVDRDVYATTDGARYATAIYAVLDTPNAALTIVNAGHPAVLVLPPQADRPMRVEASGPALGLIEAGGFASRAIDFAPGTVLLAVTDGATEAVDEAGRELGDDALEHLLIKLRAQSAAQICQAVLDAVGAHRGLEQDQDDVTAMVVKGLRA
jgi:serine phosphatase RsbU (regulator of sigma subunit)